MEVRHSGMRWLMLLAAGIAVATAAAAGEEASPPPGLTLVYAVTSSGQHPPVTTVWAQEIASGLRRLVYRDTQEERHVLVKIASSDLVGAARTTASGDLYVVMGPATVLDTDGHMDTIRRIGLGHAAGGQAGPEAVMPLPLCFSEASAYGLWNRAPVFAVSPDASRFAVYALREGGRTLARPSVRILSASGEPEWEIPLEDRSLTVADLAFSADGRLLAYVVGVQGDEHTLEPSLLPEAGVYLADIAARSTRLLYRGFAEAVAWGPRPDRLTIASRVGDIWSTTYVGAIVSASSGRKVGEFSLRGVVRSLCYSAEGQWLAAQARLAGADQVWLHNMSDGWGRQLEVRTEGGALTVLGLVRLAAERIGAEGAGEDRAAGMPLE